MTENVEPGTARVKQEFVIDPPKINADVTSTDKDEPPKKRHRGQNKNRPRTKRISIEESLCPSLVSETGVCTFGEKCRYIHDVKKYMAIKPHDLGNECYSYKTHGKCNFGFACLYGSNHIITNDEGEYKNKIDESILGSNPPPKILNEASKELRNTLRKKKFQFPKANAFLKDKQNVKIESKFESLPISANDICGVNGKDANVEMGEKRILATSGTVTDEDIIKIKPEEKRQINFKDKLYLAPLTTCGNLPFRVICKSFGADVTCGEMAMATSLLQGNTSEWALLKRHPSEDIFGIQVCGAFPDSMARCCELISQTCEVDFVDINMGCPIDLVFKKGSGCALMQRKKKLFNIVNSMNGVLDIPLTCKMRAGIESKKNTAHTILPQLRDLGVSLVTVHGRSREARYTKSPDWNYIEECAKHASPMPLFGNGDVMSYEDYNAHMENKSVSGIMIGRGALIKPWLFTEIKEQRHWDISSSERLATLQKYVNMGLLHWGSDNRGVETTRRFLLEWLSFLHRYIPLGVLERVPQQINEQPPYYVGRDDLETLMASPNCNSWVKISEMLLGPIPDNFQFLPKHKANSYK